MYLRYAQEGYFAPEGSSSEKGTMSMTMSKRRGMAIGAGLALFVALCLVGGLGVSPLRTPARLSLSLGVRNVVRSSTIKELSSHSQRTVDKPQMGPGTERHTALDQTFSPRGSILTDKSEPRRHRDRGIGLGSETESEPRRQRGMGTGLDADGFNMDVGMHEIHPMGMAGGHHMESNSSVSLSVLVGATLTLVMASLWAVQRFMSSSRNPSEMAPFAAMAISDEPVPIVKPAILPNLAQKEFPKAREYDVIVIGAGPGGEAAAVSATYFGAKVALIERRRQFGGPTGLTSKAVREAVKQIGATCDALRGNRKKLMPKLWEKNYMTLRSEAEVTQAHESRGRLQRAGVSLFIADSTHMSADGKAVTVSRPNSTIELRAKNIVIATGSRANRPSHIPFQEDMIIDATEITTTLAKGLPASVGIVGGGIIAVEYATVLASVGVGVTLYSKEDRLMTMLPAVLRESQMQQLKDLHILLVTDDIDSMEAGDPEDTRCRITCGNRIFRPSLILYSGGRDANSQGLGLEEAGVEFGKYGRIAVDKNQQTNIPGVYAIGDVVGGGLASMAAKGGRDLSRDLFGPEAEEDEDELFGGDRDVPLTLWTIPEIASVGKSVEQLEAKGIKRVEDGGPIVTGIARFDELARGRLAGGSGFVQVVAQHIKGKKQGASEHRIVGVHIIGPNANELIQLGALLVHTRTSLETVTNTPFAAVTLTVLFQLATDDALCNSPFSVMSKEKAPR